MPSAPSSDAPPGSLSDMMTALQRADAAQNVGDARQIAQMIAQHYPAHTKELLSNAPTPPPRPADPAPVTPPIAANGTMQTPQAPYPIQTAPGPGAPPPLPPSAPSLVGAVSPPPVAAGPRFLPSSAPGQSGADPSFGYVAPNTNALAGAVSPPPAGPQPSWAESAGQTIVDFARAGTAGIMGGRALAGGANAIAQTLSGNPTSWQQGEDNFDAAVQQSAQRSPWASLAGNVFTNGAQLALGGGLASRAIGAAADASIPLLSPLARGSQAVAETLGASAAGRAALGAGGGAASGAVDSFAHGGSGTDILSEMALGAITAPIIGKAAELAITKVVPAAVQGWTMLAKKMTDIAQSGGLDNVAAALAKITPGYGDSPAAVEAAKFALAKMKVDPDKLEQTHADFTSATGTNAPVASVMQAYAQAQLRDAAAKIPDLGNPIDAAAQSWRQQGPTMVGQALSDATANVSHAGSPTGQGGVQTLADLVKARNDTIKATLDPVRQQLIPILPSDVDVLRSPAVQDALSGGSAQARAFRSRVNDAIDAADAPPTPQRLPNGRFTKPAPPQGNLSVDDVETLRQSLQGMNEAGNPKVSTSDVSDAYGAIKGIGARNPTYAGALDTYGQHSAYIEGYGHGFAGKPLGEVQGSGIKQALPTGPAYVEGHASGTVSGRAAEANDSPEGAARVAQQIGRPGTTQDMIRSGYGDQVADNLAAAGQQFSKANSGMSAIAPHAPVAGEEHRGPAEAAAHAGGAILVESHYGLIHNVIGVIKGMFGNGPAISDAGAEALAHMATETDPRKQALAFDLLRRQGARESDLKRLIGYISALGGASAASQIQGVAGR